MRKYVTNSTLSKIILTAFLFAFFAACTLSSFAQALPGESNNYVPQGGGNVNTPSGYTEARDPSGDTIVRTFRGTDNRVWVQVGDGNTMTIGHGETQTFYAPAISYYGNGQFLIVHTGTDNLMYFSIFLPGLTLSTDWEPIPQQSSTGPPSLAWIDELQVVVGYIGTDGQWWSTGISDGEWANSRIIGNGGVIPSSGFLAPSIAYDSLNSRLWALATYGGDLYYAVIPRHAENWSTWQHVNGSPPPVLDSPSMAIMPNGNMLISITAVNQHPYFAELDDGLRLLRNFTEDTTGWQTNHTVNIMVVPNQNQAYAMFTGNDNVGYWKYLANQ